jgi:hypothetical protein
MSARWRAVDPARGSAVGDEQGPAAGRAPDVVSNQRGGPRFPVPRLHGKPDAPCVHARRVRLHVENGVAAPTRVHTIPKGALIMVISTRFSISTDGYEESND